MKLDRLREAGTILAAPTRRIFDFHFFFLPFHPSSSSSNMPPNNAALASMLLQQQCQPIYHALDCGNQRQAVQAADGLLRTTSSGTPAQSLARALKALALFQLRKEDEALTEVDAVLANQSPAIYDINILTPITFVLDRTGQRSKSAELLDAATKQRPDDFELATKAFEALLVAQEYLKAQQLAARMFKAFNNSGSKASPADASSSKTNGKSIPPTVCSSTRNRYFWWSILSYLMLATETPGAPGAALALTLAERMVQKHITSEEGKLDEKSDEDLELYINIILAQGEKAKSQEEVPKRQQQALALLEELPGSSIAKRSLSLGQLKLDLLKRSGSWQALETTTRTAIEGGDRNWVTIEKWIESVVELVKGTNASDVADKAMTFTDELVKADSKRRDYPLARLALYHELRRTTAEYSGSHDFIGLLGDYVGTFGRKLCCYEDLLPFLDALSSIEADRLLAIPDLSNNLTEDTPLSFKTEDEVIRVVNAAKIRARISNLSSSSIKPLLSAFYASLPISAKIPKTVPRPGADFVLIAAQLILSATSQPPSTNTLLILLCILTHASQASPASYSLKLLCLRIYMLLGCPIQACKIWQELKIRGIQNESLGWLWIGRPSDEVDNAEGSTSTTSQWRFEAKKVYREYDAEGNKVMSTAFQRGNYSSVVEFCDFKNRLERSLQRQVLGIESCRRDIEKTVSKESSVQAKTVLDRVAKAVDAGLRVQWDHAVIPSFCNEQTTSMLKLSARGTEVDDGYLGFEAARLAALSGAELPQSLVSLRPSDSRLEEAEQLYLQVLQALEKGEEGESSVKEEIEALLLHVQKKFEATTILPWEEGHLLSLLVTLRKTLQIRSSPKANSLDDTLQALIKIISSRPPLTLAASSGASTPSSDLTDLEALLKMTLESQKGGLGVREKVCKDVREEVSKHRRSWIEAVELQLKSAAE